MTVKIYAVNKHVYLVQAIRRRDIDTSAHLRLNYHSLIS